MIHNIPFVKMNAVTERIATIFNAYVKRSLESNIGITFNEVNISGSHGISRHKKGRHPSSILKSACPVFHLAYDMNFKKEETVLSASAFSTDVMFVDSDKISDRIIYRDTVEDTTDIRYTFDIVTMNVDIAMVEETKQKQILSKRVFDTLYEAGRLYEITTVLEVPLSENIIQYWKTRFHANEDIEIEDLCRELQFFSTCHLRVKKDRSTGKDTIVMSFPTNLHVIFEESDMSDGDEDGLTTTSYIVARIAKLTFNAPSMIYLNIDKKDSGDFVEQELGNNVLILNDNIIEDRTLDTYDNKTLVYHNGIKMNSSIVSVRSLLSKYEYFLEWYIKTHEDFKDVLKIIVRDASDASQNKSYTSSEFVDISYKDDLYIRNNSIDISSFDLKIYLNMEQLSKFNLEVYDEIFNPTKDDTIDKMESVDEETLLSPELSNLI